VEKLLRVRVIVHDLAANFSPRMAVERHLVHPDNHLCLKTETSQKTNKNARPLKT
jgi:hypothetical protein